MPTLGVAISACLPDAVPLIEHKSGTPEAYLEVLRDLEVVADVVVQSFDWDFLRGLKALDPSVRIGALGKKELKPEQIPELIELSPEWVAWDKELSEEHIAEFHEAGFKVAIWTVNDPGLARELVARGVDAIITDRPSAIRSAIAPVPAE